jgi:hypothetical protein
MFGPPPSLMGWSPGRFVGGGPLRDEIVPVLQRVSVFVRNRPINHWGCVAEVGAEVDFR